MTGGSKQKIVLVKRSTRLDELITRFNTVSQAKFYIEHLGADFNDYKLEHEQYQKSISEAKAILSEYGLVQVLDRSFVPNFIFGGDDLVVAVGQDGLVANILKYLKESQRLLGVNPDPKRWDGVLLPFDVKSLKTVVPETIRLKRKTKKITLAQAVFNDGQTLLAVNDFFIGHKTHLSARYIIKSGKSQEHQSSSGIIVSTGLGSSAWFKSLVTGAFMVAKEITGMKDKAMFKAEFPWNADYLYYTVREPFPSKTSRTSLVFGKITNKSPLEITSKIPENGVIFSDGIEDDFINFNSGVKVEIKLAEQKGLLVV